MDNGFGVNFIAYIINQYRSPPPGLILRRRGKDSESLLRPILWADIKPQLITPDNVLKPRDSQSLPLFVPSTKGEMQVEVVGVQMGFKKWQRLWRPDNNRSRLRMILRGVADLLYLSAALWRLRTSVAPMGSLAWVEMSRAPWCADARALRWIPRFVCAGHPLSTFTLGSLHRFLKQKLKDVVLWIPGE